MANLNLVFDLLARDKASTEFRKVGSAAERAGKDVDRSTRLMSGSLKAAGGALLGLGIGSIFTGFVKDAAEAARIGRLTDAVITSTGGAANVTAKQVENLATAISNKTAVDDESIQAASNLILTFTKVRNEVGKGNDIFNQATQAAVDMSAALGTDAKAAALQLGKALNDPIKGVTALSRAGVSFTQQQKDQIRAMVEAGDVLGAQKLILAEMQTQFGGAAEAAADPLQRLTTIAGNLGEEVGGFLLPAIEGFAGFLTDDLLPAARGFADFIGDIPGPIKIAVGAIGAIVLLKGPVSRAYETIALKALYARDAIAASGSAMGGVKSAGRGLVGFLGGPWGIAIGAAVTGISLLASGNDDAAESEAEHKTAVQNLADALRESNGEITENIRLERIREAQQKGLIDIADRAGVSQRDIAGALDGSADSLGRLVAGLEAYGAAQTTTIQDAEGYVTTSITEQGQAALDAAGEWTNFSGQVSAARLSNSQLQGVLGASTTATNELGGAAGDAAADVESLKDELDKLTGASVSTIEAESRLHDALDAGARVRDELNGEILTGTGALNLNNESGRKAADVLLDVRDSGNELISTMQDQGATFEQVRKRDAELRASFITTAKQMGIGQREAELLAADILGIPKERTTRITAPTKEARDAIGFLQTTINNLKGRTVTITAEFAQSFGSVRNVLFGSGDGPGMRGTGDGPGARMPAIPRVAVHRETGDGFGLPVSARFDVGRAISDMTDWAKANATPQLSAGVGWSSMWNTVRRAFGSAVNLHSAYRPGSITATGNLSYHASGRAIDITPSMRIFEWLRANYPGSRELIYSPAGGRQIWNGQSHMYSEPTRGDHWDHIHWAMANGGVIKEPVIGRGLRSGGSYMFGEAGPETVTPGLPNSGPVDLSMDTIVKLARVMRDGAENVTAEAFGLYDSRFRNN